MLISKSFKILYFKLAFCFFSEDIEEEESLKLDSLFCSIFSSYIFRLENNCFVDIPKINNKTRIVSLLISKP